MPSRFRQAVKTTNGVAMLPALSKDHGDAIRSDISMLHSRVAHIHEQPPRAVHKPRSQGNPDRPRILLQSMVNEGARMSSAVPTVTGLRAR
jgi:hypothetical protein